MKGLKISDLLKSKDTFNDLEDAFNNSRNYSSKNTLSPKEPRRLSNKRSTRLISSGRKLKKSVAVTYVDASDLMSPITSTDCVRILKKWECKRNCIAKEEPSQEEIFSFKKYLKTNFSKLLSFTSNHYEIPSNLSNHDCLGIIPVSTALLLFQLNESLKSICSKVSVNTIPKYYKLYNIGDASCESFLILKGKVAILQPMILNVYLTDFEYSTYLSNLLDNKELYLLDKTLELNHHLQESQAYILRDILIKKKAYEMFLYSRYTTQSIKHNDLINDYNKELDAKNASLIEKSILELKIKDSKTKYSQFISKLINRRKLMLNFNSVDEEESEPTLQFKVFDFEKAISESTNTVINQINREVKTKSSYKDVNRKNLLKRTDSPNLNTDKEKSIEEIDCQRKICRLNSSEQPGFINQDYIRKHRKTKFRIQAKKETVSAKISPLKSLYSSPKRQVKSKISSSSVSEPKEEHFAKGNRRGNLISNQKHNDKNYSELVEYDESLLDIKIKDYVDSLNYYVDSEISPWANPKPLEEVNNKRRKLRIFKYFVSSILSSGDLVGETIVFDFKSMNNNIGSYLSLNSKELRRYNTAIVIEETTLGIIDKEQFVCCFNSFELKCLKLKISSLMMFDLFKNYDTGNVQKLAHFFEFSKCSLKFRSTESAKLNIDLGVHDIIKETNLPNILQTWEDSIINEKSEEDFHRKDKKTREMFKASLLSEIPIEIKKEVIECLIESRSQIIPSQLQTKDLVLLVTKGSFQIEFKNKSFLEIYYNLASNISQSPHLASFKTKLLNIAEDDNYYKFLFQKRNLSIFLLKENEILGLEKALYGIDLEYECISSTGEFFFINSGKLTTLLNSEGKMRARAYEYCNKKIDVMILRVLQLFNKYLILYENKIKAQIHQTPKTVIKKLASKSRLHYISVEKEKEERMQSQNRAKFPMVQDTYYSTSKIIKNGSQPLPMAISQTKSDKFNVMKHQLYARESSTSSIFLQRQFSFKKKVSRNVGLMHINIQSDELYVNELSATRMNSETLNLKTEVSKFDYSTLDDFSNICKQTSKLVKKKQVQDKLLKHEFFINKLKLPSHQVKLKKSNLHVSARLQQFIPSMSSMLIIKKCNEMQENSCSNYMTIS